MRIAFLGTPEFAAVSLAALVEAGHDIACVYSQPPRPAGRGQVLRPSAVQALAEAHGFEVRTPTRLVDAQAFEAFAALQVDVAIVAAYGLLLPQAFLDAPRLGCLNVHASLLPRWRGAAPIQRCIMAGDDVTGVCIMQMEEGLDTGPVCARASRPLLPEMTAGELHDRLAVMGAGLLVETLKQEHRLFTPQCETGLIYARKISKAEAKLSWGTPALEVQRHIHGLSPFPGAWFTAQDQRIKVLRCAVVEGLGNAPSGTVLDDQLTVACESGAVRLLQLQREGKGPVDAAAFLRGFPLKPGTRLL